MRFISITTTLAIVTVLLSTVSTVDANNTEKQSLTKRLASRFGAFFLRRYYRTFRRNHPLKNQAPYGAMRGVGFGFRFFSDYAFQECNMEDDALSSWIKNGSAKRSCIEHQGNERCWFTFVPDSVKDKVDLPVVVHLHGMGGCATRPAMGWANVAEDNGFVVVWPQGTSRKLPFPIPTFFWNILNPLLNCWNDGTGITGCNKAKFDEEDEFYGVGIDDVGFLEKMVKDVKRDNPNINPNRVYFSGHSNGGVMAQRFALETTEKNILAGLVVIGANTFPNYENWENYVNVAEVKFDSETYNPIPVFFIAGRNDNMSPFEFWEERASLSGAIPALNGWANENKCDTNTIDGDETKGYTRHIIQNGCANGATVELLEIHDAGHHPVTKGRGQFQSTPWNVIPSCPFRGPVFRPSPHEPDCQFIDIDTTSMAWDFISKFERPNNVVKKKIDGSQETETVHQ